MLLPQEKGVSAAEPPPSAPSGNPVADPEDQELGWGTVSQGLSLPHGSQAREGGPRSPQPVLASERAVAPGPRGTEGARPFSGCHTGRAVRLARLWVWCERREPFQVFIRERFTYRKTRRFSWTVLGVLTHACRHRATAVTRRAHTRSPAPLPGAPLRSAPCPGPATGSGPFRASGSATSGDQAACGLWSQRSTLGLTEALGLCGCWPRAVSLSPR